MYVLGYFYLAENTPIYIFIDKPSRESVSPDIMTRYYAVKIY